MTDTNISVGVTEEIFAASYADLMDEASEGDGFVSLSLQGVALRHLIFCLYGRDAEGHHINRYVYVIVPDGGPVEYLRKWRNAKQELRSWVEVGGGNPVAAMEASHRFVLDQVIKEIKENTL